MKPKKPRKKRAPSDDVKLTLTFNRAWLVDCYKEYYAEGDAEPSDHDLSRFCFDLVYADLETIAHDAEQNTERRAESPDYED